MKRVLAVLILLTITFTGCRKYMDGPKFCFSCYDDQGFEVYGYKDKTEDWMKYKRDKRRCPYYMKTSCN